MKTKRAASIARAHTRRYSAQGNTAASKDRPEGSVGQVASGWRAARTERRLLSVSQSFWIW